MVLSFIQQISLTIFTIDISYQHMHYHLVSLSQATLSGYLVLKKKPQNDYLVQLVAIEILV